jgi:ABC-type Fe3+/spermidine/putrescine transport system ATPase subunit
MLQRRASNLGSNASPSHTNPASFTARMDSTRSQSEVGSTFTHATVLLKRLAQVIVCRILCLDEIGAHLSANERLRLEDAIGSRLQGVTCLRIAHDLQTLLRCHLVGVMQMGSLCEFGTPSALLEDKSSLFATSFCQEQKAPDMALQGPTQHC